MTLLLLELALMLVVILVASELFTNALEHLGERLGISEGVTGSLFAAVGTALPETDGADHRACSAARRAGRSTRRSASARSSARR